MSNQTWNQGGGSGAVAAWWRFYGASQLQDKSYSKLSG
jgi:hypothetical protein